MPLRRQPDLEEFFIGNIALEMISGPIDPIVNLKDRPYEGYMVANGILTAPFFAFLGDNYAALKMTSLIISLGTLIALTLFTTKEFGKCAGILVFFLYFFPPPGVLRLSLWATGHYPQSQFITLVILLCFFPILFPRSQNQRPSLLWISLFAILCGLAIRFHPYLMVTVAYCVLLVLVFQRRLFNPKTFLTFLILFMFALGVSGFSSLLKSHENVFMPGKTALFSMKNLQNAPIRLKSLFGNLLFQIWNYSDLSTGCGPTLDRAFYFLSILSYTALALILVTNDPFFRDHETKRKISSLLLFPPFFTVIYAFCNLIDPKNLASARFLLVIVPFIFIYICLFLSWLMGKGRTLFLKGFALTSIFFIAAANIISFAKMLGPIGKGDCRMRAVWLESLGNYIGRNHMGKNPNPTLQKIVALRYGEDKKRILQGFFDTQLEPFRDSGMPIEDIITYLELINEPFRDEACLAAGRFVADAELGSILQSNYMEQVPVDLKECMARGMGSQLGWRLIARYTDREPERFRRFEKIASKMDSRSRQGLYYGLGSILSWQYKARIFKPTASSVEIFFEQESKDKTILTGYIWLIPPDVRDSFIKGGENNFYYSFVEW